MNKLLSRPVVALLRRSASTSAAVLRSSSVLPNRPAFEPRHLLLSRRGPTSIRTMASGEGQDIHVDELIKLQSDKSVLIIDVREKSEIAETGVLPGGINIPLGELDAALTKTPEEFETLYHHEKPQKDTKIVFSCRSGRRSLAGLNIAKKLGYTNLLNFAGGWLEWEEHMKKN